MKNITKIEFIEELESFYKVIDFEIEERQLRKYYLTKKMILKIDTKNHKAINADKIFLTAFYENELFDFSKDYFKSNIKTNIFTNLNLVYLQQYKKNFLTKIIINILYLNNEFAYYLNNKHIMHNEYLYLQEFALNNSIVNDQKGGAIYIYTNKLKHIKNDLYEVELNYSEYMLNKTLQCRLISNHPQGKAKIFYHFSDVACTLPFNFQNVNKIKINDEEIRETTQEEQEFFSDYFDLL